VKIKLKNVSLSMIFLPTTMILCRYINVLFLLLYQGVLNDLEDDEEEDDHVSVENN
jgi:hypothetical protein